MKCKICEHQIKDKNSRYCSMCGSRLSGEGEYVIPHLDRISYLWERQSGGKFLHENFKSMEDMGVISFKKPKPNRPQLSDFPHINLFNLQVFSFLYLKPSYAPEFYKMIKLLGYYSVENVKVIGLDKLINALNRTGLFWRIFQNEKVKKTHEQGWRNARVAIVELTGVDKKRKMVKYTLEDSCFSSIRLAKYCCFMEIGALSGQAEGLYSGFWDGVETKCVCAGDPRCEVNLTFHKSEREPEIPLFTKEDFASILNQLVDNVVKRGIVHRKVLGDFLHLFAPQCVSYLLTTVSPGHTILSKHSGIISGERIAEKAGLDGENAALEYASDLFLYLKAGILHEPESRDDKLILRMDESVYSSGVNNINMKLDIFPAGIIEGLLNQSTGERWQVHETKCLANGDDYCQFTCKKQT